MTKKVGLLSSFSLLLLVVACVGGPASHESVSVSTDAFFFSAPTGNGLVFIGVAGKRSNPKDTIQVALEDAARRVAAFNGVSGEFAVQNNIGSGIFEYTLDTYTQLSYDMEGSKKYVDALEFNADIDSIEIENALIIRTTYPGTLPVPVGYRPTYSGNDKKPDWVGNPPTEIAGYDIGVGYSGRYSSLANACNNSFNNAIFAIIRNVNTATRSSDVVYQSTGGLFGYRTTNDSTTYSYGFLTGFYVLDMWIDPKDKSVWTLAIANKNN
jgi:hypothetical protein